MVTFSFLSPLRLPVSPSRLGVRSRSIGLSVRFEKIGSRHIDLIIARGAHHSDAERTEEAESHKRCQFPSHRLSSPRTEHA